MNGTRKPAVGDFDFADTVNFAQIENAAKRAANALARSGDSESLVVGLVPEDGTQYHLWIGPRLAFQDQCGQGRTITDGVDNDARLVSLIGPPGNTYPWGGDPIHYTYGLKWSNEYHTSRIVAAFLSCLSWAIAERGEA